MKKHLENIDIVELENYFSGRMSSSEMNALEKRAQDDPFLKDAMEGYESHPEALKDLSKHIKNQKQANKSFFGSRTLAIIAVAAVGYITAVIINENGKDNSDTVTIEESSNDSNFEVEIVRDNIDTLIYANQEDQTSPIELSTTKQIIQENVIQDQDSSKNIEFIYNVEPVHHNPDLEIIEESNGIRKVKLAPFTYIENLYTVDYREIQRENSNIKYTRFELTGLTADFESEDTKSRTDLIEKEVEIPYFDYLSKTMKLFSRNDYKKSLNRFLTILEQYPKDLNALFYGGHCYFNLSQYDKALEFFNLALASEQSADFIAFREETEWYKSKTLIKLGRTNEAMELLDAIIMKGQFYSKDAIALKKQLH